MGTTAASETQTQTQTRTQPPTATDVRLVVTRGNPTAAELAALVVALHRQRTTEARVATSAGVSGWVRAARLEGAGHRPVATTAALTSAWGSRS